MLLHGARRATRVDDAGDLVRLEDQDRFRQNPGEIDEGVTLLEARCAAAARAEAEAP
jgi:RNA polymerase sigma-70 factor, ECF subfamily